MTLQLSIAGAALIMISAVVHAGQSGGAAPAPGTAAQKYRNIQVLRTLPADDLMRTMHLIRSSLGTTCDYCHDVEHYEADTRPAKAVARRMIQMVMDLNARSFEGRTVVTCNTCHRGATRPVPNPPIGQGQFADTTRAGGVGIARPSAAGVLNKYLSASGGRVALESLKERVADGVLLSPSLVRPANSPAAVVNRGKSETVAIRVSAEGQVQLTVGAATNPISMNGRDGKLDPRRPLRFLDRVTAMTVLESVQIDGAAMHVLSESLSNGRSQQLFFDAVTGLLRRTIVHTPTPVGFDPEQVDFEDYRIVDGLAVPFTIRTSYLDDNHYGTTLQFTSVRDSR